MVPLMAVRLKARREARGLSQEQVAEALGVDRDTVSRWERGRNRPTGAVLIKALMTLYDITQSELDDWFAEWSIGRLRESDKYFIRGYDFLASSGMDYEALLEKIVELDISLIPNLTLVDEGTVDQWVPIFQANPNSWRLLTHAEKIVGYWHYVCLKDKYFDEVRRGALKDSLIDVSMVDVPDFFDPKKNYKMYVVMMGVDSAHQFYGSGGKLVNSFVREIEKAAMNGTFFSDFVAVAYSPQGVRLCENFGLDRSGSIRQPRCSSIPEIFHGTGSNIATSGHASRYGALARAYKARFR